MKKNLFNNRRFKYGTLATVITVGFLVALVLINVVATLLLERFPLSLDLTAEKRFQLTQDSVELLQKLDRDVTLTVCAKESEYQANGEYYKLAYEVIKNYAKNSSRVTVNFVDLLEDPTFAQKYPEETLGTGDIIVQSDLRYKKIVTSGLFEVSQSEVAGTQYRSKAEQTLTGAILYATDSNPSKVLLLAGQSRIDMSAYQSLLEANNFSVVSATLLTEELDKECDFAVLPQPDADLTPAEAKKLSDYLDNDGKFGKSLLFVASSDLVVGPVLKNFLAEWGIEIDTGMIFETDTAYAVQNNFIGIQNIADEELAAQINNARLPVVVPFSHPVKALFDTKDNRETKVILQSQPTAIFVPADYGEDFDINAQEQSAISSIVLGSRTKYIDNVSATSSLLAIGSENMLLANFLAQPSMGNSSLMAAVTNSIASKEDTVQILPVDLNNTAIPITSGQVILFMIILVGIVPLLLLGAALFIFLRRRHL